MLLHLLSLAFVYLLASGHVVAKREKPIDFKLDPVTGDGTYVQQQHREIKKNIDRTDEIGGAYSTVAKDSSPTSSQIFDSLQSELLATDQLIDSQLKKLEELKSLRNNILNTNENQIQDLDTLGDDEVIRSPTRADLEFKLIESNLFHESFVLRSSLNLSYKIKGFGVISFYSFHLDAVVVAEENPTAFHFYDIHGHKLFSYHTGRDGLCSFSIINKKSKPMVVAHFQNNDVVFYEIAVKAQNEDRNSKAKKHMDKKTKLNQSKSLMFRVPQFYIVHESSIISTISVVSIQRQKIVISAHENGEINMYLSNSTFIRTVQTSATNISSVSSNGRYIVFSNGLDFGIISFGSWKTYGPFELCRSTSKIKKILFDPLSFDILFVSNEKNEILTFKISSISRGKFYCKTVYKVSSRSKSNSMDIGILKGYLISSKNQRLQVYNISNVQSNSENFEGRPTLLLNHRIRIDNSISVQKRPASLLKISQLYFISKESARNSWVVLYSPYIGSNQFVVYQCFLSYSPPTYDISWIRTPFIVFIIVGVLYWQYSKYSSKPINNLRSMDRIPGVEGITGGTNSKDLESILNKAGNYRNRPAKYSESNVSSERREFNDSIRHSESSFNYESIDEFQ